MPENQIHPGDESYLTLVHAFVREGTPRKLTVSGKSYTRMGAGSEAYFLIEDAPTLDEVYSNPPTPVLKTPKKPKAPEVTPEE